MGTPGHGARARPSGPSVEQILSSLAQIEMQNKRHRPEGHRDNGAFFNFLRFSDSSSDARGLCQRSSGQSEGT